MKNAAAESSSDDVAADARSKSDVRSKSDGRGGGVRGSEGGAAASSIPSLSSSSSSPATPAPLQSSSSSSSLAEKTSSTANTNTKTNSQPVVDLLSMSYDDHQPSTSNAASACVGGVQGVTAELAVKVRALLLSALLAPTGAKCVLMETGLVSISVYTDYRAHQGRVKVCVCVCVCVSNNTTFLPNLLTLFPTLFISLITYR